MGELIRTERLTRRYLMGGGVLTAVDSVSLSFEEGEKVAIVGRSGSGKSTLLHLLGGLDRPTSGDVVVRGRPLAELADDDLALYRRTGVGFVFQSFNLVPVLTAAQNVELPMTLAGVPRAERRRRAAALIERMGLSSRGGHRPSELSGGEQQRVAIARALINQPAIVLADEPTGNLDSRTGAEVMDLLARLNREQGRTIVIVSHDPRVVGYAHRCVHLLDGHTVDREG